MAGVLRQRPIALENIELAWYGALPLLLTWVSLCSSMGRMHQLRSANERAIPHLPDAQAAPSKDVSLRGRFGNFALDKSVYFLSGSFIHLITHGLRVCMEYSVHWNFSDNKLDEGTW